MKRLFTIFFIAIVLMANPVYAKDSLKTGVTFEQMKERQPVHGIIGDESGNLYIFKHGKLMTGYFKFEGHWYYGHKTSIPGSPRGSLTQGKIRLRDGGNRWYAYESYTGQLITNDFYVRRGHRKWISLKLNKDNSIRYIFGTTLETRNERYSTAERRWQIRSRSGRWYTPEQNQTIPYDWIDWQR